MIKLILTTWLITLNISPDLGDNSPSHEEIRSYTLAAIENLRDTRYIKTRLVGKRRAKQAAKLHILPAYQGRYVAGKAHVCRRKGDIWVHVLKHSLVDGRDMSPEIITAITHELGHHFGAAHDDRMPETYMHPDAARYARSELKFSGKSVREMRLCQKG